MAFVRLGDDPDPIRVRVGWVTDTDIRDMAATCTWDTLDPEPVKEGAPA